MDKINKHRFFNLEIFDLCFFFIMVLFTNTFNSIFLSIYNRKFVLELAYLSSYCKMGEISLVNLVYLWLYLIVLIGIVVSFFIFKNKVLQRISLNISIFMLLGLIVYCLTPINSSFMGVLLFFNPLQALGDIVFNNQMVFMVVLSLPSLVLLFKGKINFLHIFRLILGLIFYFIMTKLFESFFLI